MANGKSYYQTASEASKAEWTGFKDYERLLGLLFGPGGAEAYMGKMGTQIGMATQPYYQQWQKQQAGGLAGRGGLGGGAQVWAMGEAQKARSGQMIGATAGAAKDVLAAKMGILQQLISAEAQKFAASKGASGQADQLALQWLNWLV